MANDPESTEAKTGKPPRALIPEGSRVYAIGDIHGRADLLRRLHDMILADARDAADLRKVVIYLGDYVDRGPDSRGVVDILLGDPLPGFESIHLRGNHDDWLFQFLSGGDSAVAWLMNGGHATLDSYGVEAPRLALSPQDLEEARHALKERLPGPHLEFFEALALTHLEGDYLFVHAGIRPQVPLEDQDRHDLMWIREEFLDSGTPHAKFVVHGHTPAREVQTRDNRIGIDTAASATGRLTCLVLEADERRFLHT